MSVYLWIIPGRFASILKQEYNVSVIQVKALSAVAAVVMILGTFGNYFAFPIDIIVS